MRSRRIPMTFEEFELLPRELGWRYEYVAGHAEIRPRQLAARLTVPVEPREVLETGCKIRPVIEGDQQALVEAFCDGFGDTVEYCDRTAVQIRQAAEDAVATFFGGKRGPFHVASRLAVPWDRPLLVAGAALVVQKADGAFLDMLFLRREWQRRGLASALTATVLNALFISGEKKLGSAYNVANAPSVAWHHKFGFREVPDPYLAHLRAQLAQHELSRRMRLGDLSSAERAALEAEIREWEQLAEDYRALIGGRVKAGATPKSSAA